MLGPERPIARISSRKSRVLAANPICISRGRSARNAHGSANHKTVNAKSTARYKRGTPTTYAQGLAPTAMVDTAHAAYHARAARPTSQSEIAVVMVPDDNRRQRVDA